ncbi:hypothetical protein T08_6949 [Trichinella sp. T8]|nr:hypothetical protein T08_6949 [Trichinella sp. T8]
MFKCSMSLLVGQLEETFNVLLLSWLEQRLEMMNCFGRCFGIVKTFHPTGSGQQLAPPSFNRSAIETKGFSIGADKKALVDPDRSCFAEKLSLARLRRPLSTLTSHKWRSLVWYNTVRQNRSCIIHTNTLLQRAEVYLNSVNSKSAD